MIRRGLRAAAEILFGGALAVRRVRGRRGDELLVLAFHNVVPDDAPDAGDRPLHLRLASFVALIDRLLELCDAVPLATPIGATSRPRFAVTFDDAYRGALTLALPELEARGVPATVFVPTDLVGDHEFWWDAIADPEVGLSARDRTYALDRLRGDHMLVRDWALQQGRKLNTLAPEWRSCSIEELRTAHHRRGIELAVHTATHRAMDLLDDGELDRDLRSPLEWFEQHELPFRRILTYPYGRWSARTRAMAAALGYESAWLVSGGWTERTGDRLAGPRLNVPAGASLRGMMLRIAGFIGS